MWRKCILVLIPALLAAHRVIFAQTAATPAQKMYLEVDLTAVQRTPENLKGKDIRILDRFGETTDLFPATLKRKANITPDKYVAFQTSSSVGSRMLCFLPRTEKDMAALVGNLTKDAPIRLEGTVYGIVNGMTIFLVDRIFSGHEPPKESEKPRITMLMQWEGDSTKYKYVIPKPGQYFLADPTTKKKITVTFEY